MQCFLCSLLSQTPAQPSSVENTFQISKSPEILQVPVKWNGQNTASDQHCQEQWRCFSIPWEVCQHITWSSQNYPDTSLGAADKGVAVATQSLVWSSYTGMSSGTLGMIFYSWQPPCCWGYIWLCTTDLQAAHGVHCVQLSAQSRPNFELALHWGGPHLQ